MLLERYYDETLAQASYLIGCEQSREAIVIDPNVVEDYEARAQAHRMKIRQVTETHIHADFVSGSRALAVRTQARLLLSGHGANGWSYRVSASHGARLLKDADTISVGRVRLEVLHTPGHTPEHIAFLVTDTATGDHPMGIVSGDFLFVGDVGRPDLLERAAKVSGTMESAARQLFESLGRLRDLPDYLQVWPGHGAGSACGKALGSVPQTTLGYERLYNPALQLDDEEAFVRWVLADQPEPPAYFAIMKAWNRDGRDQVVRADNDAWMDGDALLAAVRAGHQVVDVRGVGDFGKSHLRGTLNIPAGKTLATYAGTVLSYDRPVILLVGSAAQRQVITRQLSAIGLDVQGAAMRDVADSLARDGRGASVRAMTPKQLAERLDTNAPHVIDVRGRSEWNEGHLAEAAHIYLGDLMTQAAALDARSDIVVHCQSGARSSIAASMLMAAGFPNVATLVGGVDAWRKAGLPLTKAE